MKRLWALALVAVAACPAPEGNAHQLWIAPNGSELKLQLAPVEPNPF